MMIFQTRTPSDRFSIELAKWTSIMVLGAGVGLISAFYSPLLALGGTLAFAILTVGLYVSSQLPSAETSVKKSTLTTSQNRILFSLCYLAFFLSMTIPKSGRTVANIPITTANLLIMLALAGWSLKAIFAKNIFARIPFFKTIIVFILYGVTAAIIGIVNHNSSKAIALEFAAFIGFIPVYFLVCTVIQKEEHLHKLVNAIIFSLILVCAYGVLQIKLGFGRVAIPGITEQYGMVLYEQFGGRWNIIAGGGQKLYSTFQNGNILGNHLATFLPVLAGIIIGIPSFRKKILLSGVFIFAWYILFLTYSRGAVVAAISGMLVFTVLSRKVPWRMLILLGIFVAILGAFFYQYADRPEFSRYNLQRLQEDPNQFSAGRIERAQQTLDGFIHLPLVEKVFGVGLGGILITPSYRRIEYVDNLYLTLLFKIGIFGLLLMFWMFGTFFLTLLRWRSQIRGGYMQGILSGGIAGLISALVHNLADMLWFFPPLPANFWFLAGIAACVGMIGRQKPDAMTGNQKQPGTLQRNQAQTISRVYS